MSKPFDVTLKDLGVGYPRDFLCTFDEPPTAPVRPLNVDLSTVTTAADLVLGVGDPLESILHIDFQASASASKHRDVLVYNGLLFRQYDVPVHSIVVLLRPQAAHSNLSGTVAYASRPTRGSMTFGYEIVRLWERPAEQLLAGALGTLPLAMLGGLPVDIDLVEGLTGIANRMIRRLQAEAPADQRRYLLTTAFVLTGLRVKRNQTRQVFMGVRAMRESDSYMGIIDEGREEQARDDIHSLAAKRFGPADDSMLTRLQGITDLQRLKRVRDRLLDATSWQDLLDTP